MTESARIVQVRVRVKPGSRKGPLVVADSGSIGPGGTDPANTDSVTVYLQQRPVDGAANDAMARACDLLRGAPERGQHSPGTPLTNEAGAGSAAA